MKTLRTALLAAAMLAVTPTMAMAQDENPRHDHGDRGNRGDRGDRGDRGNHGRPAPPQANYGAPAPRGNWGGPAPAAQPQLQRAERGVWPGWRGDRGNNRGRWQAEPDARPVPPQATNVAPNGQDRSQWHRDDRSGRTDDRRWDRDRGQWSGGDRRSDNDGRRWDNDNHRWSGGDRHWDNDNHRWSGGDRRWDNDRRWSGSDRRWSGGDHRWDPGRWRNDHRYDWRSWRSGHRDLFRGRYYAPRGYHYRSVYAGFFLEPFFYGSSYWLADPYAYRLPPVEWPLRWVRYYDDALLVDVTTGEVIDVIQGFFW